MRKDGGGDDESGSRKKENICGGKNEKLEVISDYFRICVSSDFDVCNGCAVVTESSN